MQGAVADDGVDNGVGRGNSNAVPIRLGAAILNVRQLFIVLEKIGANRLNTAADIRRS